MPSYLRCFAVINGVNGLLMIIAPDIWYQTMPGVMDTGPFNMHFVRDIGLAFTAAGTGLWLGVKQIREGPSSAAIIAMIFLAGHALLHLFEMMLMTVQLEAILRDIMLIVLPATIAVLCLFKLHLRSASSKRVISLTES